MYICDFSRSVGAGSATTRNTRGLTRSVIARIVPPFPAPSRPSNMTITRRPLCFTQAWRWHSSAWSLRRCFSYSLPLSLAGLPDSSAFRLSPIDTPRDKIWPDTDPEILDLGPIEGRLGACSNRESRTAFDLRQECLPALP